MKITVRSMILPAIVVMVIATFSGCAERKMTVISDPPGALVYLDGQEKGITPVTFKFNFYGHRTFRLKRDGYQETEEIRHIRPPLLMTFPLDLVTDLTPIPGKDHKTLRFVLKEPEEVDKDEIIKRGLELRERTYRENAAQLKKLGVEPTPTPDLLPEPSVEKPAIETKPDTKKPAEPEPEPKPDTKKPAEPAAPEPEPADKKTE